MDAKWHKSAGCRFHVSDTESANARCSLGPTEYSEDIHVDDDRSQVRLSSCDGARENLGRQTWRIHEMSQNAQWPTELIDVDTV